MTNVLNPCVNKSRMEPLHALIELFTTFVLPFKAYISSKQFSFSYCMSLLEINLPLTHVPILEYKEYVAPSMSLTIQQSDFPLH